VSFVSQAKTAQCIVVLANETLKLKLPDSLLTSALDAVSNIGPRLD